MAFSWMLPLLVAGIGADPKVIATGDYARVEQALSEGVRARALDGWVVIDTRTVNDELVVTLSKGETYERHVMHFDTVDSYRVEADVPAPADLDEPSEFINAALGAPGGGGLEVEAACGDYYVRAFVVDHHATGEFAEALIARTLATADNLFRANTGAGQITFGVERKGQSRDLVVWLDRKGKVIEAQLRRFEYAGGGGKYQRMTALRKALAKTRVLAIDGTTLILPKGKFALDPDGSFLFDGEDPGEGCGC